MRTSCGDAIQRLLAQMMAVSISHDIIVKQHGGSIEVDAQPREFTEISVILPRTAVFV
jgi:hypothetical protein